LIISGAQNPKSACLKPINFFKDFDMFLILTNALSKVYSLKNLHLAFLFDKEVAIFLNPTNGMNYCGGGCIGAGLAQKARQDWSFEWSMSEVFSLPQSSWLSPNTLFFESSKDFPYIAPSCKH
jgi:hypothetical protein